MSKIVGIGANVCDTLFTVPNYPTEDTKMRAEAMKLSGGGPCATGLVTASKLGSDYAFIGNLTDDNAGKFLMEDMKKYNVSTDFVTVVKGCTSFSSCIWLSKDSAARTYVFFKGDIPVLKLNDEQKKAIADAEFL